MTDALPPRSRRSPAKHRAILAAAAEAVASDGYTATTIEGIAARAGVGKQTIYRWWPSKPALFVEVYNHLVPQDALQADTGDVFRDLKSLLSGLFAIYRRTPAARVLAGLIAEAQHDPAAADAVRGGLVIGRRGLLTEPLRRGVDRGRLAADFDVEWTSDAITALIWHRLLSGRTPLTDADAHDLVAKLLGTRETR